ncbi:similar to Saccharomyces cerevisiae YLR329W REC102 Protein involved in early stages of meiotic recombination [Maudiozyma saulgeensis]|uniref:Similar to Saccharomyces cerevisiae YLR329W REC102 Protein involved in early stages of meiotic recombination n=1 Tax=Maudiozyma saulgeensis TaxID=1789683 RepID=A0A1X7RAX2_9SACH|nr:similar to Saccharomyces cerevisiae YLR329W REC102 Protein involved in early stages of meiotic recombination [Kazachstania saulgeensis]
MTHYLPFCPQYIKTYKTAPYESITVSKWNSQMRFSIAAEHLATGDQCLFLPSTGKKSITILIQIEFNNQKLTERDLQSIRMQLGGKKDFWESMYFKTHIDITKEKDIIMLLECRLWTQSRINVLLESERFEGCNVAESTKINYIEELVVNVSFNSTNPLEKEMDSLRSHLREYMSSLILSQLEFRFPLVFSRVARKRVIEQENSFLVISHAIKGDPSLILKFIRLVHNDQTSLSIFQILSSSKFRVTFEII